MAQASPSLRPAVRGLVLAVGAAMAAALCFFVVRSEVAYRSADLAASSLPVAAFFTLLLMLALRPLLGAVGVRVRPQDLLLIYVMLATTVGLSSLGFAQSLIIQLPAPAYRATAENRWAEAVAGAPSWVVPRDPRVLRGFYMGGDLWRPEVIGAWVPSLTAWGLMLAALTGAMLSLAWLLQRRFIDEERLVFPLAVVPVEVSGLGAARVTASRLFWIGLGLAVALQALNAVRQEAPWVPALRVLPTDLAPRLASPPWNAVGSFWIALYPSAIGLGYLLPTDTSLSCWAWQLLVKAEYVFSGAVGTASLGWPLQGEQAQGAMLTLAVLALWPRRGRPVGGAGLDTALVALGACFAALAVFGSALGLKPAHAAAFFTLYFAGMIAVTYLRAHVGPMWNPGTDVAWLLMAPTGSRAFGRRELAALAWLRWFSYGDCRGAPMPTQLEALKIGRVVGWPPGQTVLALALALAAAIPASLLSVLDTYYRYGADTARVDTWRTGRGDLPYQVLAGWLGNPQGPKTSALVAVGLGAAGLWLHAAATSHTPWWPLRPAGFALAISGTLEWLWFPILVAWAAKTAVLRWGGMHAYRRSFPLFVGLVVGDYTMSGVLAILSCVLHRQLYRPFPI